MVIDSGVGRRQVEDHGSYHTGQLELQRRMGVESAAARAASSWGDAIPPVAVEFLRTLDLVFLGWQDASGRVWASALVGKAGFMTVDENILRIGASPLAGDPIGDLVDGTSVGLLAIEFETRRRMVVTGTLWRDAGHWLVKPARVFSQCPKHIRTRPFPVPQNVSEAPATPMRRFALTPRHRAWIGGATTFLLASHGPQGSAGVSHRGGSPGFVRVLDERTLEFPDYPGNKMFLTLGNIATHPRAGLLFLDFETGSLLQMTGAAKLLWDAESIQRHPGAQLVVRFQLEEIIEIEASKPER